MGKDFETPFQETGIWNMAGEYTQILSEHVVSLHRYHMLASLGALSSEESLSLPPEVKLTNRIEALRYMREHTELLLEGSLVFIKNKKRKYQIENELKKVTDLKRFTDAAGGFTTNHVTHQKNVKVHEDLFFCCFQRLKQTRKIIMPILHRENLIGKWVKEWSPKEYKAAIMKRMVEYG